MCLFLFQGWHEDMERKMSLTSLDQSKLGSRNALNRRVIIIIYILLSVLRLELQPHGSSL